MSETSCAVPRTRQRVTNRYSLAPTCLECTRARAPASVGSAPEGPGDAADAAASRPLPPGSVPESPGDADVAALRPLPPGSGRLFHHQVARAAGDVEFVTVLASAKSPDWS